MLGLRTCPILIVPKELDIHGSYDLLSAKCIIQNITDSKYDA